MFIFFLIRGKTIFTRSDDDYCTVEFLSDSDYLSFSFKQTSIMLTPSINKIRYGTKMVDYDDPEVRSFIEMRYVQKILNKNVKNGEEKVREIPFGIKKCETDDYKDAGDLTNS